MEQSEVSQLQQALDVVQSLSMEEQETLIELVQHRLAEWRRIQIARNAAATLQAVREGRAQEELVGLIDLGSHDEVY